MPDTLQAVGVVLLAVLPGALHTWAFEREAGNWGIGLADRTLRFVGVTCFYQLVFGYPIYRFWLAYVHHPVREASGKIAFQNLIATGQPVSPVAWLLPVAYVLLPVLGGTVAATAVRKGQNLLARVLTGRDPAPRAWDALFSRRPAGVIRAQLKNGPWIGGLFGPSSYAAGYPEEQDLYLERSYLMKEDGSFALDGSSYIELGSGLLINFSEVQALEFFPEDDAQATDQQDSEVFSD